MTADPLRRAVAEGLGTALLLAVVVGSGIMAGRLSLGNDAIALLANAIATGCGLFVLIMLFGPLSGAHFNPAVSWVAALSRDLAWRWLPLYVAAQLAGGVIGVWLAHAMFDLPVMQTGVKERTGSAQWLAEGIATFGLILTIRMLRHHTLAIVAASVGLYITAAYWFTASTSFANPVVTVARALTESFAGIRPIDVPAFIAAQLAGAWLGCLMANWLSRPVAKPTQPIVQTTKSFKG